MKRLDLQAQANHGIASSGAGSSNVMVGGGVVTAAGGGAAAAGVGAGAGVGATGAAKPKTCTTCGPFHEENLRAHFKGPWHAFNLKRKGEGKEVVDFAVYEQDFAAGEEQ